MNGEIWHDPPQLGSWNMAMDQAMLEYASATQQVLLRIYQWSKPTISLGYFQAYEAFAEYPELQSLDCVRRLTGGGAILHDRELTYSIAAPGDLHRKGHSEELYRAVHRSVIEWLREIGFPANLWEESNHQTARAYTGRDSFWCFERRSEVDIVIDGRKVLGSAQRRNSMGLLQHGSLLIEASSWAPHLEGLDLRQREDFQENRESDLTASRFGEAIQKALDNCLECRWTIGKADEFVCERTKAIAAERFSTFGWTQSKNRHSP